MVFIISLAPSLIIEAVSAGSAASSRSDVNVLERSSFTVRSYRSPPYSAMGVCL